MPEIGLYLDEEDELQIVRDMFDQRLELVPDLHYSKKQYLRLRSERDFLKYRKQTGLFFAVRPDFARLPLELDHNQVGGKEWFFIVQRNGGPALTFNCGGTFESRGVVFVKPGSLHHYPTFWDYRVKRNLAVPVGLRQLYLALGKSIKRTYSPVRFQKRKFWVGPCAAKRRAAGAELVGL